MDATRATTDTTDETILRSPVRFTSEFGTSGGTHYFRVRGCANRRTVFRICPLLTPEHDQTQSMSYGCRVCVNACIAVRSLM